MDQTPPTPTAAMSVLSERYRLDHVLGSGGMGRVWAATDLRLRRPVAVKVLREDMAVHADVRARFETEARSAARLTHPNVVAVFDAGEDDGTAYIVMERLPGTTRADRVVRGPLASRDASALARDMLAALAAAHEAGIVHRDVKPGNVLDTLAGSWKMGDFGIAKSLDAPSDVTSTGLLVGSPAYLAPERLAGAPATPASDVYAAGVVLYEALTGRRPFEADSPLGLAAAISAQAPPPLRAVRPDLPGELVVAVEVALSRDPEARFDSARAMLAALTPAVPAHEDTVRSRPPAQRVAAPTRSSPPVTTTRRMPVQGHRQRRRRPSAALVAAGSVAVAVAVALVLTGRAHPGGGAPAGQPGGRTSTSSITATTIQGTPVDSLTPELDRALHDLEQEVKP